MLYRAARNFTSSFRKRFQTNELAGLMFTIPDGKPGSLNQVLQCFLNHKINLTRIQSKPANQADASQGLNFYVDFESPDSDLLRTIVTEVISICGNGTILGSTQVPWFPRTWKDINLLGQIDWSLPHDHPGFGDPEYINRRQELQNIAKQTKLQEPIPRIDYNQSETQTWRTLYEALTPLLNQFAVSDYKLNFREMRENGLLSMNFVPQPYDVNEYVKSKTGFQLKPIASMESARDFLNTLAFRVYPINIHMRHSSQPYFSMDPDIAHEMLGHCPMLANSEYCELLQEIGLASLGVSDQDIHCLLKLYFYSIESGITLTTNGEKKIYGARLLSSVDEIHHTMGINPELRHFDPYLASKVNYNRKELQPIVWFSKDFKEARNLIKRFASGLVRPFNVAFDRSKREIKVDHKVKAIQLNE